MRVWGEPAAVLSPAVEVATLRALEGDLRHGVVPSGATIRDAHTHLGTDADGHALSPHDLADDMDAAGVAWSVAFPANEPGADGTFRDANGMVVDAAARHPGRIMPFCRLDPRGDWAPVLHDAHAMGARGLKLHPVAQRTPVDHPAAVACVAAATALGWPVLIHAGFGALPLARALGALLDAVPDARLILAHGARGDARAVTAALGDHPGVWFDTSLAIVPDLIALPPERLLFGTDRPYGEHTTALRLVALTARCAGWTADQHRAVLGDNLARLMGAP